MNKEEKNYVITYNNDLRIIGQNIQIFWNEAPNGHYRKCNPNHYHLAKKRPQEIFQATATIQQQIFFSKSQIVEVMD